MPDGRPRTSLEPQRWVVKASKLNARGRGGKYGVYGVYETLEKAAEVVQRLRKDDRINWAYVEEPDRG